MTASTAGRRLLVWRHGRTAWNAGGRFQGQLDPPLDDVGRSQALAAAQVLRRLSPAAVITSDLARARQTADALEPAAVPEPGLRELYLGAWEGLTRAEVSARFPTEYSAWLAGSADGRTGDGESYEQVGVRATSAVMAALQHVPDDGLLVAVTHGGTARALIGSLLELPSSYWWRLAPLGNCRWSVLLETAQGWRLVEHGAAVVEDARPHAAPDVEPSTHGF